MILTRDLSSRIEDIRHDLNANSVREYRVVVERIADEDPSRYQIYHAFPDQRGQLQGPWPYPVAAFVRAAKLERFGISYFGLFDNTENWLAHNQFDWALTKDCAEKLMAQRASEIGKLVAEHTGLPMEAILPIDGMLTETSSIESSQSPSKSQTLTGSD